MEGGRMATRWGIGPKGLGINGSALCKNIDQKKYNDLLDSK